jgi:hypothetical protein
VGLHVSHTVLWGRYDLYSSNFHIPLGKEAQVSVAGSIDEVPLIPDAELPVLPDELCGIWAYIKWEAAGCPNRSQEESDKEYRSGIEVPVLSTPSAQKETQRRVIENMRRLRKNGASWIGK